jgi:hypothetical protein
VVCPLVRVQYKQSRIHGGSLSEALHKSLETLVLVEGIEPTRPCGHRILSPARLPVPPHQLRWVAYHEKLYRRDAEDAEKGQSGRV